MPHFSKEILEFLKSHLRTNVLDLALKSSPFPDHSMKSLIQQLVGMQVARKKFPFYLDHPQIRYPVRVSLEQSSSEALAKYKATLINGDTLADLTGGFGVDTFWLGKNRRVIHYVEPNADLQILAKHNFKLLGLDKVSLHETIAEDFLANFDQQLDWIYLDPSRREGTARMIGLQGYQPNIYELETKLLLAARNVMIKVSPMQDISEIIHQLTAVQKIIICEWDKEVKEVLIILGAKSIDKNDIPIEVVSIHENSNFDAKFNDLNSSPKISAIDQYIFEPGPALQKSGLNNHFANQFGLSKIHAHSQLFTSSELFKHPLGKSFKVEAELALNKKKLMPYLKDKKANVVVRNFPMKAPEIKKKLGIKEGGDQYLLATTGKDDKPLVLVCNRV